MKGIAVSSYAGSSAFPGLALGVSQRGIYLLLSSLVVDASSALGDAKVSGPKDTLLPKRLLRKLLLLPFDCGLGRVDDDVDLVGVGGSSSVLG